MVGPQRSILLSSLKPELSIYSASKKKNKQQQRKTTLEMGQQHYASYLPQNNGLSEALLIPLQIKSCLNQTGWYIRTSDGEH